jgi:glycogen synthase
MELNASDFIFHTKAESWVPLRAVYHQIFSEEQITLLQERRRATRPEKRCIVFLSLENRFASLGGLGTITKYFPQELARRGEKVLFVSPFYKHIPSVKEAVAAGDICKVDGTFFCQSGPFRRRVSRYTEPGAEIPTWFIDIEEFFTAGQDPYDYREPNGLLLDSLAFCAAVPSLLRKLGIREHIVFHANDWETAPISLTSKWALCQDTLKSAATVLTLHNAFDHGLPPEIGARFFPGLPRGETVLQCCIPFLDAPLTTVSTPFAHELRHDPLQQGHFANHLQRHFAQNPPIGVEHGLFGHSKPVFSAAALAAARQGQPERLLKEKSVWRQSFEKSMAEPLPKPCIGKLRRGTAKVPVFFMSGRLDMGQKGYDLILHAFTRLKPGSAKLVFCLTNPRPDDPSFEFFREIARQCRGDVTIWPFRLSRSHYQQFLKAASFLVMPSLYEPFGAATEGFMGGTPVIARATGGLWCQVRSLKPCPIPAYYHALFDRHLFDAEQATGILFRERYGREAEMSRQWRELIGCTPRERLKYPLYRSMVDAAHAALLSAIEAYGDSQAYGRLLLRGSEAVAQFSWLKAADKYRRIYDLIGHHR